MKHLYKSTRKYACLPTGKQRNKKGVRPSEPDKMIITNNDFKIIYG